MAWLLSGGQPGQLNHFETSQAFRSDIQFVSAKLLNLHSSLFDLLLGWARLRSRLWQRNSIGELVLWHLSGCPLALAIGLFVAGLLACSLYQSICQHCL